MNTEKKTAEEVASTIPCACSDCGMREPEASKMIAEYSNQQLAEFKAKLKVEFRGEVDWTTEEIIMLIDSIT